MSVGTENMSQNNGKREESVEGFNENTPNKLKLLLSHHSCWHVAYHIFQLEFFLKKNSFRYHIPKEGMKNLQI